MNSYRRKGFARRVGVASVVVIAFVSSGCANRPATKDVVANRDQYMADNFQPAQLPAAVKAALDKAPARPDKVRGAHIDYTAAVDEEGRHSDLDAVAEVKNLGNGYVQRRLEFTRNGIPYRMNFDLSQGGMYSLKIQVVFANLLNAQPITEVKEIKRFDRGYATPTLGASYAMEATAGNGIQIVNFRDQGVVCKATEVRAASTVHASLAGQATIFDCELSGDTKLVTFRTRYAWLADYDVAVLLETANSTSKAVYTVKNITFVR